MHQHCNRHLSGVFYIDPPPCGRNWVLACAVPPQCCHRGARPRRIQKEMQPPARRPCCGSNRQTACPEVSTASGDPFQVPDILPCALRPRARTRVRKCLQHRGRSITMEQWLDPLPSRHAGTVRPQVFAALVGQVRSRCSMQHSVRQLHSHAWWRQL